MLLSDIPENLEVAEDCAVSFRNKDVADLREKLEMLIRRPDRVKHFEGRARAHILEHYSWDKVTEHTEALYREMMDSK